MMLTLLFPTSLLRFGSRWCSGRKCRYSAAERRGVNVLCHKNGRKIIIPQQQNNASDEGEEKPSEKGADEKKPRKRKTESVKLKAKKKKKEKEDTAEDKGVEKPKRRRKKKNITDALATSEPKPGCAADLQELVRDHYADKRSIIELEELELPDSCFLASNDLSHSLSSYLKEICPKWAKVQKNHAIKKSVVLLIICSSALRTIELIKQLTAFKGEGKVLKLFAKHIKVEEQMKLLAKGVAHIGVGTPGRIKALIEKDGLTLDALKYLVLDWNWRDQKLRRMVDIPEVKVDMLKLLETRIIMGCRAGTIKLGLF